MSNNQVIKQSALAIHDLLNDLSSKTIASRKTGILSVARLSIIEYLLQAGPKSLSDLANYRNVSAASMSRLVSALVKEGLLLVANSKKDRRSKIFLVTNKGKSLVTAEKADALKLLEIKIESLTVDDQLRLNKAVELVTKVIHRH